MVGSTIKEILDKGVELLRENHIQNPILDAQLILANLLKVDKLYIMTNIDQKISQDIEKNFINDILKRTKNMPLQYIVGLQEFMGLTFNVNSNVLIPRPDTEILVEEVIKKIKPEKNYDILDIGTGSGCISISLAKFIENCQIFSVDISSEALKIAKDNAKLNDVEDKIVFLNGDIFEPFISGEKFDIMVSNPPYIETDVIETLDANVRDYEPRLALDGGIDGMDYYRRIINQADKYLNSNGLIFFEIGFKQANSTINLLKENGFADINIAKDLAGLDRVISARLCRGK